MNRKLFTLTLASAIAISLSACVTDDEEGNSSSSATTGSSSDAEVSSSSVSTGSSSSAIEGSSSSAVEGSSSSAVVSSSSAAIGGDVTFTHSEEVVSIDEASSTIVTRSLSNYCDGSTLVRDYDTTSQNYTIAGGKLTLIGDEYDCQSEQWSGSSSGIIGTWTGMTYVDNSEASENCDDVSMPFTLKASSTVVTASSVTSTVTIQNYCPADAMLDENTTKIDCNTVSMDMGTGSIVTMHIDALDLGTSEMVLTFTGPEGTCTADLSDPQSDADCASGDSDASFLCLMQVVGLSAE